MVVAYNLFGVKQLTNNQLFSVIVESTDYPITIENSLDMLIHGVRLCLRGLCGGKKAKINTDPWFSEREKPKAFRHEIKVNSNREWLLIQWIVPLPIRKEMTFHIIMNFPEWHGTYVSFML